MRVHGLLNNRDKRRELWQRDRCEITGDKDQGDLCMSEVLRKDRIKYQSQS